MSLRYYKSPKGNFGDDFNSWLWPKLISADILDDEAIDFFGIGSLINNKNISALTGNQIILCGTGLRPENSFSEFNFNTKFHKLSFLRGPLSSQLMQEQYEAIADGAYAFGLLSESEKYRSLEKKYEVSFMPYFKSVPYQDWENICESSGIHYISPFSENGIEYTLAEIAQSKKIICEAMHAAILADSLRVPWHRLVYSTPYTEGKLVSEFKWADWQLSIDLYNVEPTFIPFYEGNLLDRLIFKNEKRLLVNAFKNVNSFHLSEDFRLRKIEEELWKKIETINLLK